MSTGNKHDSGAAQGARRATEQAPESSAGGGRWSAKRKMSVVLELLRGADLEATSRKHRVTIATLTQWRDRFLAGGEAGMKSREVDVDDEENRRLKSVVANLSVDNELLREKIARLEGNRPLAFWKRNHEPHPFAFQQSAVRGGSCDRRLATGPFQLLRRSPAATAAAASRKTWSETVIR